VVTGSMCPIVESARVLLRLVWPVRQIGCNCVAQCKSVSLPVRYSVRFFGGSGDRAPGNDGRIEFSWLIMFVLADSVNYAHSTTGPTRPAGPATRRTSSPLGADRHAAAAAMGTARYVTGMQGRGVLFFVDPCSCKLLRRPVLVHHFKNLGCACTGAMPGWMPPYGGYAPAPWGAPPAAAWVCGKVFVNIWLLKPRSRKASEPCAN
jgi:hypothetical protein